MKTLGSRVDLQLFAFHCLWFKKEIIHIKMFSAWDKGVLLKESRRGINHMAKASYSTKFVRLVSTHCKVTGWFLRLRNFFAWNTILFLFPSTLSKGRLYNNSANSVCCLRIPFCASSVIVSLHENSSRDKKSKKGNGNHSWQHCTFYSLLTKFLWFNKTCYEIAAKKFIDI